MLSVPEFKTMMERFHGKIIMCGDIGYQLGCINSEEDIDEETFIKAGFLKI